MARLRTLRVSNFRSIGEDLELDFSGFTALVGPNGSGKSNILDSLRFLRDALTLGLEPALTQRLGIERVRRVSPRGARDVKIGVEIRDGERDLDYSVTIKSLTKGRYVVDDEALLEYDRTSGDHRVLLHVVRGVLATAPDGLSPSVDGDELALLGIAAHPSVRPVVDTLRSVRVHSLYPQALSQPQSGGAPPPLDDTGSNWCSVLRSLSGRAKRQLADAMGVVLDDVIGVSTAAAGGYYSATFTHRLPNGDTRPFAAAQESDGTLRLAGLITALVQDDLPPVLGIEEPELTINPGLLHLLNDHLQEASSRTQVIITTHSPDLLDLLPISSIRVVARHDGVTSVGRVAQHQRAIVREGLSAPGGLLRSGGFDVEGQEANLFDQLTTSPTTEPTADAT